VLGLRLGILRLVRDLQTERGCVEALQGIDRLVALAAARNVDEYVEHWIAIAVERDLAAHVRLVVDTGVTSIRPTVAAALDRRARGKVTACRRLGHNPSLGCCLRRLCPLQSTRAMKSVKKRHWRG